MFAKPFLKPCSLSPLPVRSWVTGRGGWQLSISGADHGKPWWCGGGGQHALTHACSLSICVHMLSRHNWRIYGTSWKRGGPERTRRTWRILTWWVLARIALCILSHSLSLAVDVVAIFAIVHCVRLLCSLFYFVLTNQTCKLLDSSSRFALTAAGQAAIRVACGMLSMLCIEPRQH